LIGFGVASRVLSRGQSPEALGRLGAAIGIPGFAAIIASSAVGGVPLFLLGTLMTGAGAGLFGHATLTATIRRAPDHQIGLALGAWGAVQATCAGLGVALAGIVRDILVALPPSAGLSPHLPYNIVFGIDIAFLALAILIAVPLGARLVRRGAMNDTLRTNGDPRTNPVEAS
jgi:BCD family chlorophyll transporter-like MFS transporter